jgi:hypothetical protein
LSEHPLPDDLSRWPNDPHDLLGVSHDVTPRELRRAYNRLIRIYKPEQHSEAFRRVREAYEGLLRYAEWFGSPAEPSVSPDSQSQPLPSSAEPPPDQDDGPRLQQVPDHPVEESISLPVRRPEEELEELWEQAVAGQPHPAYERLAQMQHQHVGRTEVYLRLHWLLTLYPDLEPRRAARDWLVEGLLSTSMAGPLSELYQAEVEDDPAEAVSERFGRLLNAQMRPEQLADLAEWRMNAVSRLHRWDVLGDDLKELRQRFGPGEDEPWLRPLFALADRVAWEEDAYAQELMDFCRREIARFNHHTTGLSYKFDRFDFLQEASAGCRELREQDNIPGKLRRLLPASWYRPLEEYRSLLVDFLASVASDPVSWLNYLDRLGEAAPTLLAMIDQMLDRIDRERDAPADKRIILSGLLNFLARIDDARYTEQRPGLLTFCVDEAIAPEEMAEVMSALPKKWKEVGDAWAQSLLTDWPLRHVCRACRLFWA